MPERARSIVEESKRLRSETACAVDLAAAIEEDLALVDLADPAVDAELLDEIEGRQADLGRRHAELERAAFFSGPDDACDAVLMIRAGAGGVDAMDWAEQLERMYLRWLGRRGLAASITDRLQGEEAGIHRTEIEVRGRFAFGLLRGEIGVHRICHISAFDAQGKKQTSFAAVDLVPLHPEAAIELRDQDLEFDTFCSGGPGGQNVNKVASAVRVKHLPTGRVVKCQVSRSQHENKKKALEILASRLRADAEESRAAGRGPKVEARFGHQIRTYVIEPYQMVKDHRSGFETGDVESVLNGDLDGILSSFVKSDSAHFLGRRQVR